MPIVDELQQQYGDIIEFIRFDLNTPEGNCEYDRQSFNRTPAMLFIDSNGTTVERTDIPLDRDTLQQKLEDLLNR